MIRCDKPNRQQPEPSDQPTERDAAVAVLAADGLEGWRICRRCGCLSIPPGWRQCWECVSFTTTGATR